MGFLNGLSSMRCIVVTETLAIVQAVRGQVVVALAPLHGQVKASRFYEFRKRIWQESPICSPAFSNFMERNLRMSISTFQALAHAVSGKSVPPSLTKCIEAGCSLSPEAFENQHEVNEHQPPMTPCRYCRHMSCSLFPTRI